MGPDDTGDQMNNNGRLSQKGKLRYTKGLLGTLSEFIILIYYNFYSRVTFVHNKLEE